MKKDNPKKLGSPVYLARKAKGLSMPELADLANTSTQQIDRLELKQREMTRHWAERLAPHLGVEAVYLVFPEYVPSPATATVPADEVRTALETFARKSGMSDSGAEELADQYLDEMLNRQSPVLDQRTAELRVAFDRIARRFLPKVGD